MEEKKEFTIEELLKVTADNLEKIQLPTGNIQQTLQMTQQIAVPIMQAVENIRACLEAFEKNKPQGISELKEATEADIPDDAEVIDLGEIGDANDDQKE